jgi:hypothetical protein
LIGPQRLESNVPKFGFDDSAPAGRELNGLFEKSNRGWDYCEGTLAGGLKKLTIRQHQEELIRRINEIDFLIHIQCRRYR